MAAAALSGGAGGFGGVATDLLGLKSSSDIFVGILTSRTVQDKLIQQFDLRESMVTAEWKMPVRT